LDEPLEGLAPIIVEELLKALRRIIRDEGMSAILVEQNAKKILGVTDHAIIIERGAVVHAADSRTLLNDRTPLETHLAVTDTSPPSFRPFESLEPQLLECQLFRLSFNSA